MAQEKSASVPTPFHGLRVLLLDNDVPSLVDIAKKLEIFSYKVTTAELPTVALSTLQANADSFDLIMADTNMPEMDCFKFMEGAQLIKDFPIILMSSEEVKKEMVVEAMSKGACFCLNKPISLKNLENVWQHVCRKRKNINQNVGSNGGFEGVKMEGEFEDLVDGKRSTKRPTSTRSDELGEFKRKRAEKTVMEISSGSAKENYQSVKMEGKKMESPNAAGRKEAHLERGQEMTEEPDLRQTQIPSHLQIRGVQSPTPKRATSLPADPSKLLQTSLSSNPNSSYERKFHSAASSPHRGVGSLKTDVNQHSLSEVWSDLQKQQDRSRKTDELQAVTDSSHFPADFELLREREKKKEPDFFEDKSFQRKFGLYLASLSWNQKQSNAEGRRSSPLGNNSLQEKSQDLNPQEETFP